MRRLTYGVLRDVGSPARRAAIMGAAVITAFLVAAPSTGPRYR